MKTGSDLIGDAHGPGRFGRLPGTCTEKGSQVEVQVPRRLFAFSVHRCTKTPAAAQILVLLILMDAQNMEIPGIAIGDAAAASLDAAAARREEERVYDTVLLSEMEYVEDDATYYYQCPCGDMFEITVEDLTNGMTIARCPSCSLKVRVDTPLPSEGKRAGGAEGASSTT